MIKEKQKGMIKLNKDYLQYLFDYLEDAKTANEIRQYLGKLLVECSLGLRNKNEEYIKYIRCIQKVLRKVSKEMTYQKTFVCGQYYEKFGNLISEYQKEKEQTHRTAILVQTSHRKLFTYLYKNGMVEINKIFTDLETTEFNEDKIRQSIDELKLVGLVSHSYALDYEYIELTAEGYLYHNRYFPKTEE